VPAKKSFLHRFGALIAKTTFAGIVSAFGAEARAKLDNPAVSGAPEDQLRAPLEGLIHELAALDGLAPRGLSLVGETTLSQLQTRPDYAVSEIARERIRDKIAASKAKGMWMGGNVPLGYDIKDRRLIVNEAEAATVRLIFRRYAELGTVALLKAELDRVGIVSKRREGAGGALSGGKRFSRGALYLMLQNRLYRGEVAHKGQIYPGQHEAIIAPELWEIVQEKFAANRRERSLAVGAEAPSLLAGLIFDSDGNRMTPTHATKRGRRYRYYVTASLLTSERLPVQGGMRIPAGDIEGLVLDRLSFFRRGAIFVMPSHPSISTPFHSMRPRAMQARFQSAGLANRDEKPRPRHCRAGDHRCRSDRRPREPGEDRRGVAGERARVRS
jgi:hypothetical protein